MSKSSNRSSKISVPEHAHPLARLVFQLMRDLGKTYLETEFDSGVLVSTVKSWRKEKTPSLQSIEAVLGSFGWGLAPYPKLDTLPDDIRAKVEEIGEHFFADNHVLAAAVAAAVTKPSQSRNGQRLRIVRDRPYWLEGARA